VAQVHHVSVPTASLGTVLERRAAEDGPDGAVSRPTTLAPDPPRDVGLRPQPAAVLGAGAALGLVAGLLAERLRRVLTGGKPSS
jgi:hypothetical protein